MPRNQMGFLRVLLYQLRQTYGTAADLYRESAESIDLATGARTATRTKYSVRRAICLPTTVTARYLGEFPGASVELGDKVVILERRDLPPDLEAEPRNYSVVVEHRRYEVLSVREYATAYLLTLKELTGARVQEQVDVFVRDTVEGADGLT